MKYLITYIKEDGFPENLVIEASCGDEAMDKFEYTFKILLTSIQFYPNILTHKINK